MLLAAVKAQVSDTRMLMRAEKAGNQIFKLKNKIQNGHFKFCEA